MFIKYLANAIGMDYSQLARMETRQVNFTISYLFKVAETLGVTLKELTRNEGVNERFFVLFGGRVNCT